MIAYLTAGEVWALHSSRAPRIELIVPRSRHRKLPYVVHRPLKIDAVDVTVVDGIPVTTPARTLIDIADLITGADFERALDGALRRGLVSLPRLRWRLQVLGRQGRAGAGTLHSLIEARAGNGSHSESDLETLVARLLRRGGLPVPVRQHQIKVRGRLVARVDFAYPEQRVAIEADGFTFHSSRVDWERDIARRNAITALGWTVIQVTWEHVRGDSASFLDAVRALLPPAPSVEAGSANPRTRGRTASPSDDGGASRGASATP